MPFFTMVLSRMLIQVKIQSHFDYSSDPVFTNSEKDSISDRTILPLGVRQISNRFSIVCCTVMVPVLYVIVFIVFMCLFINDLLLLLLLLYAKCVLLFNLLPL